MFTRSLKKRENLWHTPHDWHRPAALSCALPCCQPDPVGASPFIISVVILPLNPILHTISRPVFTVFLVHVVVEEGRWTPTVSDEGGRGVQETSGEQATGQRGLGGSSVPLSRCNLSNIQRNMRGTCLPLIAQ